MRAEAKLNGMHFNTSNVEVPHLRLNPDTAMEQISIHQMWRFRRIRRQKRTKPTPISIHQMWRFRCSAWKVVFGDYRFQYIKCGGSASIKYGLQKRLC